MRPAQAKAGIDLGHVVANEALGLRVHIHVRAAGVGLGRGIRVRAGGLRRRRGDFRRRHGGLRLLGLRGGHGLLDPQGQERIRFSPMGDDRPAVARRQLETAGRYSVGAPRRLDLPPLAPDHVLGLEAVEDRIEAGLGQLLVRAVDRTQPFPQFMAGAVLLAQRPDDRPGDPLVHRRPDLCLATGAL